VAAEFTPMFARRPDAALANRSQVHVEPVSCTRKRKLEYGGQRLARQNRLFRPETLEIAGQRLRRAGLTRGNRYRADEVRDCDRMNDIGFTGVFPRLRYGRMRSRGKEAGSMHDVGHTPPSRNLKGSDLSTERANMVSLCSIR
jgi:hypothetical protein